MAPVVTIVAPGNMGAAVGARLIANGLTVKTTLTGRSDASKARAREAGMTAIADDETVATDMILSIVPPGDALGLAEKLAPALRARRSKPIYVDCNAVNPETATRIATVVAAAGTPFVDAGIIGGPPKPHSAGPAFYASGPDAPRFAALSQYGLDVRVLDGPIGAASALKMSYAGITKGLTALGTVMMLAATRAGTADALYRELSQSQPALLAWFTRQVPAMYQKAYRWVAEMEEIAGFVGEDPAGHLMFEGAAQLYERLARDVASTSTETMALSAFLKRDH